LQNAVCVKEEDGAIVLALRSDSIPDNEYLAVAGHFLGQVVENGLILEPD
jgi:hypothetical protein